MKLVARQLLHVDVWAWRSGSGAVSRRGRALRCVEKWDELTKVTERAPCRSFPPAGGGDAGNNGVHPAAVAGRSGGGTRRRSRPSLAAGVAARRPVLLCKPTRHSREREIIR